METPESRNISAPFTSGAKFSALERIGGSGVD